MNRREKQRYLLLALFLFFLLGTGVPALVGWVASDKISWYELLSLLISIAGIVGVLASLYMIRETNEVDAVRRFYDRQFELDKLFVDVAELRPFFYGSIDVAENDDHFHRAVAMAELILDVFEELTGVEESAEEIKKYHAEFMRGKVSDACTPEDIGGVFGYIAAMFAHSPILSRYLDEKRHWYGMPLVQLQEIGTRCHR